MSAIRLFVPESHGDEITVPEVVSAYLAALKLRVDADDFSHDNYLNAQHYLRAFATAFPVPVSQCRQQDFAAWINGNPRWASGHTKKGIVGRVLACFRWATDTERGSLIDRCPLRRIKAVSSIPYKPRRAASPVEIVSLMRHGSLALKQGLWFVYRTGCRPCEMRELIWPWVHIDGPAAPHLKLERHKTFRQTGKAKIIGLDDATVKLLRFLRRRHSLDAVHVFLNCDGLPWTRRALALNLRRCAVRAGLDESVQSKVSAGCLRTTYACDLIEAGFTNREVADMLGHTTTEMVDLVYGAETRERVEHLGNVAKAAALRRRK